jgi:hypothetical protein
MLAANTEFFLAVCRSSCEASSYSQTQKKLGAEMSASGTGLFEAGNELGSDSGSSVTNYLCICKMSQFRNFIPLHFMTSLSPVRYYGWYQDLWEESASGE